MCIDANAGGIMGNREQASTYMWVKLRSKRIPKNYSTAGLKINDFVASNDLYGSFCRARVTIQSDDPDIQTILQSKTNNWSTAYFAVGDVFTCGSWIPQKNLEQIANRVACKKAKSEGKLASNYDCTKDTSADDLKLTNGQSWAVAGTAILSTGLGAGVMEALQSNTSLGGLLGSSSSKLDSACSEVEIYLDNLKSWKAQTSTNADCTKTTGGLKGYRWKDAGTIRKSNFGDAIYKRTITRSSIDADCITENDIQTVINDVTTKQGKMCKTNPSALSRIGTDVLGAAAVAIPTTFAVRDAIREGNRTKFTEAEEEFMRNVGEHIYCFIGADEAGTYGDLIEISVE